MSDQSAIQWTDATWNPVSGCTRVSAECDNCYAVGMTHRLEKMGQVAKYGGLTVLNPRGERHFNGVVRCDEKALMIPLGWKKPRRIFVNSMSDLFHKEVPFDFIDRVFAVMALCHQHTFQVLTKRPERMAEYFNAEIPLSTRQNNVAGMHPKTLGDGKPFTWGRTEPNRKFVDPYTRRPFPTWPLANVWLGTSCGIQKALERIMLLGQCPAAVQFVSMEPLLEDLGNIRGYLEQLRPRWVIVGGESGGGSRVCHVEWIHSIVRQCRETRTPVFVKQLGRRPVVNHGSRYNWPEGVEIAKRPEVGGLRVVLKDSHGGNIAEWPEDLRVREMPRTGGAV